MWQIAYLLLICTRMVVGDSSTNRLLSSYAFCQMQRTWETMEQPLPCKVCSQVKPTNIEWNLWKAAIQLLPRKNEVKTKVHSCWLKPEATNRNEFLIVKTCSCPILAERVAQYRKKCSARSKVSYLHYKMKASSLFHETQEKGHSSHKTKEQAKRTSNRFLQ